MTEIPDDIKKLSFEKALDQLEEIVDNLESGSYFVIGASTLGQVGVVWSKQVTLQGGENQISLDLRDATWAQ